MLPLSLNCPFMIVPSVFSNVFKIPDRGNSVLCLVSNGACVFGLPIHNCAFGFSLTFTKYQIERTVKQLYIPNIYNITNET